MTRVLLLALLAYAVILAADVCVRWLQSRKNREVINMTQELKPCPFCGKVPDEMHRASTKCSSTMPHAGQYHGEVWHFCGNGMLASASVYRASKADALRAAIEAWNTRAQIPGEVCEIEGTGEGVQLPVVEERTCENVGYYIDPTRFKCSACDYNGWVKYANGGDKVPRYCPNCGAKVVDE